MKRRIIIQLVGVDKRTTEKLTDSIYALLQGKGLDYSVWIETFKIGT